MFLDYTTVGSSDGTSVRRAPCSANGSAPFDGVYDDSQSGNVLICNGSTVATRYAGLRNSQIVQAATAIMKRAAADTFYAGGYKELFAQSFAYQAYSLGMTASSVYFRTADGVFGNANVSYFACTQTWATDLVGGQTTPPSPSPSNPTGHGYPTTCGDAVLPWYATQLNNQ